MSQIRGENTKPERILRSELFKNRLRFRIHLKDLPGKPDIVLRKYKTVIFVNGCFWHNHQDCRDGRIPSSNSKFWITKLNRNIQRDENNIHRLKLLGWRVIVLWECEIEKNLENVVKEIISSLKGN